MKTILKGASILTVILMLSMVFTPVMGSPVLPFERWGIANNGGPINTGLVTGWIDGVEYGNDVTSTTGDFDIDVAGDTTDSTNLKTGGYNGDTVRYAIGDLTGSTAQFFTETNTWAVGGIDNTDLNAGASVDLLKIAIVSQGSDYIALYNPTGAAVDATGYSLAVGTGAASAIAAGDIYAGLAANNVNPIPAADYLFLDMTGWGGIAAANSIQLYFGVNIVDRVEYGAIGAEPEDTSMSNAASPAAGNEIYRTPTLDTDTNACAADFATRAETLPVQVLTTIVVTPDPVSYVAGDVTPFAMQAQGLDQYGGAMSCAPVWSDTEGTGVYSAVTAGNPATATYTPGAAPIAGGYTISAVDGAVTGTATLTITAGTLTTITVTPDPVTYVSGDVTPFAMSAQGYNQFGVAMSCAPAWSDTEGTGVYSAVTAGNPATATYTPGAAPAAGGYTISAVDGAVTGTATLTITIGTLTTITVTPDPVSYVRGDTTPFAMTAQGYNENGVPMSCAPAWSDTEGTGVYSAVTAGNPATATYTPGAAPIAGGYTISAVDGTVTGTATLTITAGTLTTITVTPDPLVTTFGAGGSGLTAQGYNEYGLDITCAPAWSDTETNGVYSAVTPGNPATATYTPAASGTDSNYTISATDGAVTGTATLTLSSVPVLTYINITPDPVTYEAGDVTVVGLSAQGYDQFWAPIACTPAWSDTEGSATYTNLVAGSPATADHNPGAAPTPGSYTISATDGTVTGTATLTITWTLATITISPDPVSIADSYVGTTALTATGTNTYGITGAITPAWSDTEGSATYINLVAGNPATADLNNDGTQVAGSYTISAIDGVITGTATLTYTGGAGVTPWDIACHKSGNDLVIDWTTGTGPFDIYIADSVTGAGPYVSLASGIAVNTYTHVGALTDGLSHSYYVTADAGVTKSNLGFKLVRALATNLLANSWISLPFKTDLATADDIMDDINADGPGGDTCDIATRWDTGAQGYSSRTDIGAIRIGDNFAVTPGVGYLVHCVQPVTWIIVGANMDKDAAYTVPVTNVALADNLLGNTWIAFPYNTAFATADSVMDQIDADGSGGDDCDILTRWDEGAQGYSSRTDIGAIRIGDNFVPTPGYGYMTHMTAGNANPAWNIGQNTLEP